MLLIPPLLLLHVQTLNENKLTDFGLYYLYNFIEVVNPLADWSKPTIKFIEHKRLATVASGVHKSNIY